MAVLRAATCLSILAVASACMVQAQSAAPSAAPIPTKASDRTIVDTRADPAFGDASDALRMLLAEATPEPRGAQHFCIIGYRGASDNTSAWVHWQEGRRLILWEGRGDPQYAQYSSDTIVRSRRSLDLDRDVVAPSIEQESSTYLVTKDWAAGVLADCRAKGAKYRIGG